MAQCVKCLPLARVMIPESWDQAPHWAPCSTGSLLLPLPLPLLVFPVSLCLCQMKIKIKKPKEKEREREGLWDTLLSPVKCSREVRSPPTPRVPFIPASDCSLLMGAAPTAIPEAGLPRNLLLRPLAAPGVHLLPLDSRP